MYSMSTVHYTTNLIEFSLSTLLVNSIENIRAIGKQLLDELSEVTWWPTYVLHIAPPLNALSHRAFIEHSW